MTLNDLFTLLGDFIDDTLHFIGEFSKDRGALLASVTALLISVGVGNKIRSYFVKPKLKIVGYRYHNQKKELKVWRLLIKNIGNEVAKDVQAEVVSIYKNSTKRENFLPMPLTWTHVDNEIRNIFPGQVVYLDIFDDFPFEDEATEKCRRTRLHSRVGSGVADFLLVNNDDTKIELLIFHKKMRPKRLNISIKKDPIEGASIVGVSGQLY